MMKSLEGIELRSGSKCQSWQKTFGLWYIGWYQGRAHSGSHNFMEQLGGSQRRSMDEWCPQKQHGGKGGASGGCEGGPPGRYVTEIDRA